MKRKTPVIARPSPEERLHPPEPAVDVGPEPPLEPSPEPTPAPTAQAVEPEGGARPVDMSDRDAALADLFARHYTPTLRLAVLLGADDAEDVVAEAFWQLYRRWHRLRNVDAALAYLRGTVVNLIRMRLRHLQVARKHTQEMGHEVISAETEAILRDDQRELVAALKRLPARQREALVLRYWLGLREHEIAAAMGISCGAVKSHTARGMAALTRAMEGRS